MTNKGCYYYYYYYYYYLVKIKVNQHAKYLREYDSNVIDRTHRQTHILDRLLYLTTKQHRLVVIDCCIWYHQGKSGRWSTELSDSAT